MLMLLLLLMIIRMMTIAMTATASEFIVCSATRGLVNSSFSQQVHRTYLLRK